MQRPKGLSGANTIGSKAIRDRIRELRRVPAKDLLPNPRNWRIHPKAQADALDAILVEIGYAGALLVRELPSGQLVIIDWQSPSRKDPRCDRACTGARCHRGGGR